MDRRSRRTWWLAAALTLAMGSSSRAGLVFTTQDLGGGLFQYNLTLQNTGFINPTTRLPEPLSGLNLIQANSVFGLDMTSAISAPPGWSYFAPDPPFVDELNYFSLSPSTDIPVGASLGGFSFQSMTNPANLGGMIAFDAIGSISHSQQAMVPEPPALVMAMTGGLTALLWWSGTQVRRSRGQDQLRDPSPCWMRW